MGRTRFLCSYPGCHTCTPNMRFNIERHVWTQHVRRSIPGMDQNSYVAKLHKNFVDQYVVMADEMPLALNASEGGMPENVVPSMLMSPAPLQFGRLMNDNYLESAFGCATGEGVSNENNFAAWKSFQRLAGVAKNTSVGRNFLNRPTNHASAVSVANEQNLACSCSQEHLAQNIAAIKPHSRGCGITPPLSVTNRGFQQFTMADSSKELAATVSRVVLESAAAAGDSNRQNELLHLHPSKSLTTIRGEFSSFSRLKPAAGTLTEANSGESATGTTVPSISPSENVSFHEDNGQANIQAEGNWPDFNYNLDLASGAVANGGGGWRTNS